MRPRLTGTLQRRPVDLERAAVVITELDYAPAQPAIITQSVEGFWWAPDRNELSELEGVHKKNLLGRQSTPPNGGLS